MQPAEADLSAIPLFADLPKEEIAKLNALAHPMSYKAGDPVFRQGEDAIGVFVVTNGEFELRQETPGAAPQTERTISAGGVFGLTSVLDEGPRRASAYATTDGSCMVLSRITFRGAVMSNPALALDMMRSMARNLRELSSLLSQE